MDWLKIALNGLQIGSILATAGFAAFGLLTKFKDESGKLTKAGRIALAGIGLSALLSLGTQSVKAENDRRSAAVADEKHQAELNTQLALFKGQSAALQDLNNKQLRALGEAQAIQDRVKRSLAALQLVQQDVGKSINAIGVVGRKQDSHTARVLHTMWEDANRIEAGRIELIMRTQCEVPLAKEMPRILPGGAFAIIGLVNKSALHWLSVPANSFSRDLLLHSNLPLVEKTVTFTSEDPRIDVFRTESTNTALVTQVMHFGPFEADVLDIGKFTKPDEWRNAAVEILISGRQPGLASAVQQATGQPMWDKARLSRGPLLIPEDIRSNDHYKLAGLPCTTFLTLILNGRSIPFRQVRIIQVLEGDEGEGATVLVKTPVSTIAPEVFPKFAGG